MTKPMSIVVAALALLVAAVLPAFAQDTPPAIRVGVVDLELVGREFKKKAAEEEALTQWYSQERDYLGELGQYIFCVVDEWEKAATLIRTPKLQRTDEQKAQLKTLLDEGTKRETQYQDLRAKQAAGNLTPEEDKQLKLVTEVPTARDADLQKRVQDLEAELQRRMNLIREDLMKPVREAVNAIAAEKGFALVLEKDWVYFGGEDVTQDVIKKVNEMAPPAAGAVVPPKPGEGAPPAGGEKPKEGNGEKPAEGGNP